MWFEKRERLTTATLCLLLGIAPAAHAATVLSGDLFYTTFQTQGSPASGPAGQNVYKTHFVYDNAPLLTLSPDCVIASLSGADGLIFDPNDATGKTLLVGEQNANLVASLAVGANPCPAIGITERKADGTAASGKPNGQAYGITATPDKSHLWMLPNEPTPNPDHINVAALPLTADGVPHTVTGDDGKGIGPNPTLRGVVFIGNQGYYGDALDYASDGHFGTISSTFVTARVPVVDDTIVGGTTDLNGKLPTHGTTYDGYSGCIIASGSNQIWQICPPGVAGAAADGKFHVRAKIATAPQVPGSPAPVCVGPPRNDLCNTSNWDQTSTDNAGHMFAANNNGDLLFVDYSASAGRLINNQIGGGTAPFISEQYLRVDLDDIINGGGAPPQPPGGCPATQGFWHKASNWTNVTASVGGILYKGATTHSMTIGGIEYTQAQLLLLMPSGGLHSGAFANSLSQTIAAVLNVAAGAQVTPAATAAISGVNTALSGVQIFGPGPSINSGISAATRALVESYLTALDNYNSAVGLGCTEGTGLNIPGKK